VRKFCEGDFEDEEEEEEDRIRVLVFYSCNGLVGNPDLSFLLA
jgi:hypothetical protein